MQSKTLYFLLALSVMVALVTAFEEDDDIFDEMFENYMEKRGKKGRKNKLFTCPDRSDCMCRKQNGETVISVCIPTFNNGQVGL